MPRFAGMKSRLENNEWLEHRKVFDSTGLFVAEPPYELVDEEVDYRIELS